LYYRLNVLRVEVPPLRARGKDIALLAQHFIESYSREFARSVRGISRAAEDVLLGYGWPGNVRELRNLIERAVLLAERDRLEPADFETLTGPRPRATSAYGGFELPAEGISLEDVEKSLVVQALAATGGNQTRAAALLGMHRDQIRYRVEKFGLKAST
jgi:DNA-binding NtrC family response regulator